MNKHVIHHPIFVFHLNHQPLVGITPQSFTMISLHFFFYFYLCTCPVQQVSNICLDPFCSWLNAIYIYYSCILMYVLLRWLMGYKRQKRGRGPSHPHIKTFPHVDYPGYGQQDCHRPKPEIREAQEHFRLQASQKNSSPLC